MVGCTLEHLMTRTPSSTSRIAAASTGLSQPPPMSRREQLRLELLTTVDSLYRRRADLVSEGFIADYVALNWLEWHGGALRLTTTGENMCLQMRAGLA
jgi:hypothetical protein